MPAFRLIPISDDEAFPYARAKQLLEADADLTPKDFAPMLDAGRRMGWSKEMIRANEELAGRGACFDFRMRMAPFLSGSLFEDNVFLSITEDEQAAIAYIERLAKTLRVRVYKH